GLGTSARICYPRRRDDIATKWWSRWRRDPSARKARRARTRARLERSRGAEHDRDGWRGPIRRDTAGHQGDGRAAVLAGLGGGGGAGAAGRVRMVGIGRGDAAGGRKLRV